MIHLNSPKFIVSIVHEIINNQEKWIKIWWFFFIEFDWSPTNSLSAHVTRALIANKLFKWLIIHSFQQRPSTRWSHWIRETESSFSIETEPGTIWLLHYEIDRQLRRLSKMWNKNFVGQSERYTLVISSIQLRKLNRVNRLGNRVATAATF